MMVGLNNRTIKGRPIRTRRITGSSRTINNRTSKDRRTIQDTKQQHHLRLWNTRTNPGPSQENQQQQDNPRTTNNNRTVTPAKGRRQ